MSSNDNHDQDLIKKAAASMYRVRRNIENEILPEDFNQLTNRTKNRYVKMATAAFNVFFCLD